MKTLLSCPMIYLGNYLVWNISQLPFPKKTRAWMHC